MATDEDIAPVVVEAYEMVGEDETPPGRMKRHRHQWHKYQQYT
jgi:hypothetical protein